MKTMKMKEKLDKWCPPGYPLQFELRFFQAGLGLAMLFALCFFLRLFQAVDELFYHYPVGYKELIRGAVMPDFGVILDGALLGFLWLAVCMLLMIGLHYAYYWQESKSIYLMRRLPDRWLLHRQCLTLPLLAALTCVLTAAILLMIFYVAYLKLTPPPCLTPGQWQRFWEGILC